MKSILEVIILLLLSFLIGSNKSVDTACSLPDTSQWSVANSDICLKVNGDSIFWTMNRHIIHAFLCKQEDDKLVFYSSAGDSIVFCRKN